MKKWCLIYFKKKNQRCLGMRHLYPVLAIPEVELRMSTYTTLSAVEYCNKNQKKKIDFPGW